MFNYLLLFKGTFTSFFKDKSLKDSVEDPDPELGAFLTPGSGIREWRKSASGSGMNNPDHIF
jgi:hypothetical protein